MENLLVIIQLIIGILCCLFGFKFQKGVLAIIGCLIGYLIGNYIVTTFSIVGGLNIVIQAGLTLLVGIFSFTLFEYLISIIIGIALFIVVADIFNSLWYGYVIGLIVGIAVGILTKKFIKIGLIIATSIIGSYLVSNCIITYTNIPYVYLFGIIFIISALFQKGINKE